jgi:hypothetical protein
LALNPAAKFQEKGGSVVTYCKAYKNKAVKKIANIVVFFQHHYGNKALERSTPEACEQANIIKWDEDNALCITLEKQDLEEVMDKDITWISNLNDVNLWQKA